MTFDKFKNQIKQHEGLRLKPYRCTAGKLTIGYGRNIEDNGITEEEADYLLDNDLMNALKELETIYPARMLKAFHVRYFTVANMLLNLGKPKLLKFKKMWFAIERQDWPQASVEMLDSKWAKDVGSRANTLAMQMLTNEWDD